MMFVKVIRRFKFATSITPFLFHRSNILQTIAESKFVDRVRVELTAQSVQGIDAPRCAARFIT